MSTSPDTVSPPPGLSPLEAGDPVEIGPYRVVGRIGAGGMGAVYGALDGQGVCVAVKTVHADFAREPRSREAFAREVEMLGRADGVSTARLHAADTEAEVPWLAFDYVPGRDLRAHVRAFGPLEGDMLRTFALGAAEGLAALHAAGIAHRDIKPGNVILSPDGPKIVDFGIAVEVGTDRSEDASASYGTPGWSAPERYSGAVADPAADVFAWGGLVTLAATGRPPFGTGTADALAYRVSTGKYNVEGVPEELLGLVEAALSVEPDQRPSSEILVRALLPELVEELESQVGVPLTAADSLRGMLRDYWRGVDDAGHDPRRWAAALGVASVAGLGASTLGSGAAGSGAAGSGAVGSGVVGWGGVAGSGAAAGTAGSGMAAAGGAAATAASGGAAGTSVTTGGVLSGIATSKFGLAGAGLLATAGLIAGGFLVYDQVRANPGEAVAAAAGVLEEGQGFTAQVERAYTTTYAEEVAERTGTPVDQVVEDSRTEEEYLHSADTESFLIRGAAMGEGTVAVASHRDEIYVYGPHQPLPEEGWEYDPEHLELADGVDAQALGARLFTEPLRDMAARGETKRVFGGGGGPGQDTYAGPANARWLIDGRLEEVGVAGSVSVDEEGAPVRAEYTSSTWEVVITFSDVDTPTEVTDPQVSDGWSVVHGPICGRVGVWDQDWDVRAAAWEMDCDYAMDVVDMMFNSNPDSRYLIDHERAEHLPGHGGPEGSADLVDGTFACFTYLPPFDFPGDRVLRPTTCRNAELTGEETSSGFPEYGFEDPYLIDYIAAG